MTTNNISQTLNNNASNRQQSQEDTKPIESVPTESMTVNNDNNSLATIDVASPLITGEITRDDIHMPVLQVSQPMSVALHDVGINSGNMALNRLLDLGKECKVVVAGMDLYLLEDTEYGSTEVARRFSTEAEANAAGYTTSYNTPMPRADKTAEIRLLIQAPENDKSGMFTSISKSVGDWTQAILNAKGTMYRTFAKVILTAVTYGHLKDDLVKGFWHVQVEEHSNGKNRWFALKPTPAGILDDKTVKALRETFNLGG